MALVTGDNRKLVKDFMSAAISCAATDPTKLKFERMRYTDGVLFDVSDAAIATQNALIDKLVTTLGPVRGHRSEIEPVMWSVVATIVSSGGSQATPVQIDDLLKIIEASSEHSVRLLKPCQNIRLVQNARKISIGPVTIRRSAPSRGALRKACPKLKFKLGDTDIIKTSGIEVTLPRTIWDIELVAAEQVREQEATWLIDVALSILRMVVDLRDLGPLPPFIGQTEAHPIRPYLVEHSRITVGPQTKYSFGGATAPRTYEIGRKAQRALARKSVQKRIEILFSPSKKALAERYVQGLGWMSRGRQSEDRATRLLYFFTAIEALLSDTDKTSPVVQTVSRLAAVLLSDDNSKRALIAKDLRSLYALRSSLVHTGKRGVHDRDSNTIQYIAERLFETVWDRVDLGLRHETFVQRLSKASYGLKLRTALK